MMLLEEENQAPFSVETRRAKTDLREQTWANRTWHVFLTCLMRAMATWTV
jgi:hypothetical protein